MVPAVHATVTPVCRVYPVSHVNEHDVPLFTLVADGQFVDISGAVNVGTVHGSAIGKTKFQNQLIIHSRKHYANTNHQYLLLNYIHKNCKLTD